MRTLDTNSIMPDLWLNNWILIGIIDNYHSPACNIAHCLVYEIHLLLGQTRHCETEHRQTSYLSLINNNVYVLKVFIAITIMVRALYGELCQYVSSTLFKTTTSLSVFFFVCQFKNFLTK